MVKWRALHNGDMEKCQNAMIFFSYLQPLLSHQFTKERSGSDQDFPHQFLIHFFPSHPLQIYLPLLLHLLHLHVFTHMHLKQHHYICLLPFSSFYPQNLPICLPLSHELCPTIYLNLHHRLPLPREVCYPLHLHIHLRIPLPHDVCPPIHLHILPLYFHFLIISLFVYLFIMICLLIFIFILIFISAHFVFRFFFLVFSYYSALFLPTLSSLSPSS